MKRVCLALFVLVLVIGFSSASIKVHSFDVKKKYNLYDTISGMINLTVKGEGIEEFISSSRGGKILLKEFLDKNSADYSCSVVGCRKGFKASSGEENKTINLKGSEKKNFGFYLEGDNLEITGIKFSIRSDFGTGAEAPVSFNFFEKESWTFNKFSQEYSPRYYGCYDKSEGIAGPLLKKAKYCEMIGITESAALLAGVDVSGVDDKFLKMVIHSRDGGDELSSCIYNPKDALDCILELGDGKIFPAGSYQVCVDAENSFTNYKVFSESKGNNCGFAFEFGPEGSERDYGIYVKLARYDNSSLFNESSFGSRNLGSAADEFIDEVYGRDCTNGCILPIEVSGVSQEIEISDVEVNYKVKGVGFENKKVYDLEPVLVTLDFDGLLDLKFTGFNISKGGDYSLYLGGDLLFRVSLDDISTPDVVDIYPRVVPAGVPVKFTVTSSPVSSGGIKYKWNFGDNSSSVITSENFIMHTYSEVRKYSVSVSAILESSASPKKFFSVEAISPKEAINETLKKKKELLNEVIKELEGVPSWYRGAVEKMSNASSYLSELKKLEEASKVFKNNSDLVEIVKKLYSMNTPSKLVIDVEPNIPLLKSSLEIDPRPVAMVDFGKDFRGASKYGDFIIRWQESNILPKISANEYTVLFIEGGAGGKLKAYDLSVQSYLGEEGYLVLDVPKSEIFFKEPVNVISSGGYSLIRFSGDRVQSFEFYVLGPREVLFFTSPVLTDILLPEEVDFKCNNNNVCEKDLGENPSNCRNDCKPVVSASIYFAVVLFFALIVYTVLQMWYKRHYEKFLFEERSHLYNLLMFIVNARARNVEEKKMVKDLERSGWSHERIVYAMKKSRGERTGMLEIVPVEKIISYFRNRVARRAVIRDNLSINPPRSPVGTGQMPQKYGKINKQGFQRPSR